MRCKHNAGSTFSSQSPVKSRALIDVEISQCRRMIGSQELNQNFSLHQQYGSKNKCDFQKSFCHVEMNNFFEASAKSFVAFEVKALGVKRNT